MEVEEVEWRAGMEACAQARSRYALSGTSSYFEVFMNDSQSALSLGVPLRDMLMVMPLAWSRSVESLLAYCEPRSI